MKIAFIIIVVLLLAKSYRDEKRIRNLQNDIKKRDYINKKY
jgi:hypothetical protein